MCVRQFGKRSIFYVWAHADVFRGKLHKIVQTIVFTLSNKFLRMSLQFAQLLLAASIKTSRNPVIHPTNYTKGINNDTLILPRGMPSRKLLCDHSVRMLWTIFKPYWNKISFPPCFLPPRKHMKNESLVMIYAHFHWTRATYFRQSVQNEFDPRHLFILSPSRQLSPIKFNILNIHIIKHCFVFN